MDRWLRPLVAFALGFYLTWFAMDVRRAKGADTPPPGWTEEQREEKAFECQDMVWELSYLGRLIAGELSEDECKALKESLDPQTAPFTETKCKWRWACREEL